MSYKTALTAAMAALAADPATIFVGYGLRYGAAMGTLKGIAREQILETPVAEGLMVGVAIGLALRGRKPVVYIERADFIHNAMDAIVNHLAAIPIISQGEFSPAVILRVTVGGTQKPLFTGWTHTQDTSHSLRAAVPFPVRNLTTPEEIAAEYARAAERQARGISTALFEYRDLCA